MAMKSYFFIVFLFAVFEATFGADDSSTSTTLNPFPIAPNNAGIFVATDVNFLDSVYGKVDVVGACDSCNDVGETDYYASASTPVPHFIEPQEAVGSLNFEICESMCVCDANGKCYTRSNKNTILTLWPYCSKGVCGVYGVLDGQKDKDGLVAVGETIPSFTAGAQIDKNGTNGKKYDHFPVTDKSYPKIASIGCSGCPITTCNNAL